MKKTAKMLLVVGIVCYLLPFLVAGDTKASGFELMTTISFHKDLEFDSDDTPDINLILAFGLGIVSFAVSPKEDYDDKKRAVASGLCSLGAALFLYIFKTSYDNYSWIVKTTYGWSISLIGFIGAGICFLVDQSASEHTPSASPYVEPRNESPSGEAGSSIPAQSTQGQEKTAVEAKAEAPVSPVRANAPKPSMPVVTVTTEDGKEAVVPWLTPGRTQLICPRCNERQSLGRTYCIKCNTFFAP